MPTNHNVFGISKPDLKEHEATAIKTLKVEVKRNDAMLASKIGLELTTYMRDHMGAEGECDLRDLGVAVFWPMTVALFGEGASIETHPGLYKCFDEIDTHFPKVTCTATPPPTRCVGTEQPRRRGFAFPFQALRGKKVPQVLDNVATANTVFREMLDRHHAAPSQCPIGKPPPPPSCHE